MRLFLFLGFLMLLTSISLTAQNPVKWTFDAEKIGENEYEVVATATIENGWSVYSKETKAAIPTKVSIEDGIEVLGETQEDGKKTKVFDELFGAELVKLSGRTSFRQRIKVEADTSEVSGQISFMSCNASSCMPPKKVNFAIALN